MLGNGRNRRDGRRMHRIYRKKRMDRLGNLLGKGLALLLLAASIVWLTGRDGGWPEGWQAEQTETACQSLSDDSATVGDTLFTVHCLDVGQGSATLIVSDGHAMLVDAGKRDDAKKILAYIKEQGITCLDYLLLTHPHADHTGSAAAVIRETGAERVLLPDISLEECPTATYADVLAAIEEKQPVVDNPRAGDSYELGAVTFQIICPSPDWQTDVENLNESSIGILLTCKDNRVIVYGDGEENCESYMLANGNLAADVLIVGHHGSSTSSSEAFLDAVSPRQAVISCGADNDYGYPHKEVLERLSARGVEIFRTDMTGTVVFWGNGKNITFMMKN